MMACTQKFNYFSPKNLTEKFILLLLHLQNDGEVKEMFLRIAKQLWNKTLSRN